MFESVPTGDAIMMKVSNLSAVLYISYLIICAIIEYKLSIINYMEQQENQICQINISVECFANALKSLKLTAVDST